MHVISKKILQTPDPWLAFLKISTTAYNQKIISFLREMNWLNPPPPQLPPPKLSMQSALGVGLKMFGLSQTVPHSEHASPLLKDGFSRPLNAFSIICHSIRNLLEKLFIWQTQSLRPLT